jgi:putative lipoprotein
MTRSVLSCSEDTLPSADPISHLISQVTSGGKIPGRLLIAVAVIGVLWFSAERASGQVPAFTIENLMKGQVSAYTAPGGEYLGVNSDDSAGLGDLDLDSRREVRTKQPDRWLGKDKCKHFLLSGFWSGLGYLVTRRHFGNTEETSFYVSGGVVLSLGVTKEIRDSFQPDNRFSCRDLLFDLAGVGCGLLIASR